MQDLILSLLGYHSQFLCMIFKNGDDCGTKTKVKKKLHSRCAVAAPILGKENIKTSECGVKQGRHINLRQPAPYRLS